MFFFSRFGRDFLHETYFYHVTRRDIRHNFSPYFYMLYLTVDEEDVGISLLTFMPQLILMVAIAAKFGNHEDLPFCLFCQTVVFVSYNKVGIVQTRRSQILAHLCEILATSHLHLRMLNSPPF